LTMSSQRPRLPENTVDYEPEMGQTIPYHISLLIIT